MLCFGLVIVEFVQDIVIFLTASVVDPDAQFILISGTSYITSVKHKIYFLVNVLNQ